MNKKTLAIILNHNLPIYTDFLYESLNEDKSSIDYELCVLDNGSKKEGRSKYTTFELETNIYFGGGFNTAVQYILDNEERYDSLLFLNNDLTLNGNGFIKSLREHLQNYGIISPCFLNIDADPRKKCHWKTMWPSYTNGIRQVPFVDLQCPLIRFDILKEYSKFETMPDLMYGFGIDALLSIICSHKDIKMGVCDNIPMIHHNSLTVRSGVSNLNIQTYCHNAEKGQFDFFSKNKMMTEFMEIRKKGESYCA